MGNFDYVAEYDAIVSVVSNYIEGGKKGSATTKRAFHEVATIMGYAGGSLLGPEIQKLYDFQDKYGPAPDVMIRFTRVDISGTAANVRLDASMSGKPLFTDFLNIVKLDGDWIIVSKVFHMHA